MSLAQKWFAERGIRMGEKPVSEQLPTVIINKRALFPYGYNPSLIRYNGRLLMAYRYHPDGRGESKLAMAVLDDQFNVKSNHELRAGPSSIEDPRLFIHQEQLCVSYTVSTMPKMPPTCVVRWGTVLEDAGWRVEGQWLIPHGQNDGTALEKNWVFYSDGGLRCIYSQDPKYVTLHVERNNVLSVDSQDGLWWRYGTIRGGTVPMPFRDGRQIRFFHSRLDNEPQPHHWRYFIGAMLLENGKPVALSKRPILRGSEYDDFTDTERASCIHYKPQVVFPCGCIEHEDGWLLSVGLQDSQCAVVKVREEDLRL